jgi:lactate racemase
MHANSVLDTRAGPERQLMLPWGEQGLELALPPGWEVDGVFTPGSSSALDDVDAAVLAALRSPVGAPPLGQLARAAGRVAVVVDDGSRPTPVARILPAVLSELERGGVPKAAVTVVTALGLHRAMTPDEVRERIGSDAFEAVTVENHNCDDAERLVELGSTRRGTHVSVNRTVAEADLVVCVGCIEPHVIAGFGGGAKMIVPGVAGRATIGHNHALHCTPSTFDGVGRRCTDSPMRLDLEEAASLLRPPVFIVDAVLNGALEVVRVVAGDAVEAHRDGVDTSRAIFAVPLRRRVDVVITTSHPMDQDLRQGLKALANTIRAVRPDGVLIALIRAEEGVGVVGLADRRRSLSPRLLRLMAPLLVRAVPRMPLRDMGEEDRFFLYFALQAMRRASLLLYAPTIPEGTRRGLPFARFVDAPEEALARARQIVGEAATVAVFPDGGATYPELSG